MLRWLDALVACLLVGLVALCYWPVKDHAFVEYDDSAYVFFNAQVRGGLTAEGLISAFTEETCANWHPLTMLSHMLDVELFGMNPGRHHLTSLVIHVLNTVLLYFALRALIAVGQRTAQPDVRLASRRGRGRGAGGVPVAPSDLVTVWCCALVAALFGVHPQHVESVAWIAERKDQLSALFWMLTLLAYAWYVARPAWGRYVLVAMCLVLGLMSKPMVVTLPAVLLLLDCWPLGRWSFETAFPSRRWLPPWPLVAEKLPLLALVFVSSVVTFFVQRASGAVVTVQGLDYANRVANAIWSYFDYLRQMVWPVDLAFFYPHPTAFGRPMNHEYTFLAMTVLVAISGVVLVFHRRYPFLLVGWLWYLGTLVPVIGLVQVGDQARADRYTYIPSIGAYIVVVFGLGALWPWLRARISSPAAVAVAGAATVAVLAACCRLTFAQQATWRDTTALATHGLKITGENNYMCHFMLGVTLERQGQFTEALAQYQKSLHYNDHSPLTLQNTARLLIELEQYREAEPVARALIKQRPDLVEARKLLAASLEQQGRLSEAKQVVAEIIKLPGGEVEGYSNLALITGKLENYDAGLAILDQVERDPRFQNQPPLLMARGILLRLSGRLDEAAAQFEAAAPRTSDPVAAMSLLADVRLQQNRIDDVIAIYRRMLIESPLNLKTPIALSEALMKANRPLEAVDELRKFLRRFPGHSTASNNLAWILATHPDPKVRNGAEAVQYAEQACAISSNITPALLDTLAAAYAEAGRFDEAQRSARKAIVGAQAAKQTELARDIETRLKLYEAGQAYHTS